MSIRIRLGTIAVEDLHGEIWHDSNLEPGVNCYMLVREEDGKVIIRKKGLWLGEGRDILEYFRDALSEIAGNDEYRQKCERREAKWAKIEMAYEETHDMVVSVFEPLTFENWGQGLKEASDLCRSHCRRLHEQIVELFEVIGDPTKETVQTVAKQVREETRREKVELQEAYEPYSPEHRMQFGKYKGKTLRHIAHQHPSYAKWAAKNMTNKPKAKRGLERALRQAKERDDMEVYPPLPLDHEMTFGKHEGKDLVEIAREDPGYVRWCIENLDGKPRLVKGLKIALEKTKEVEDT